MAAAMATGVPNPRGAFDKAAEGEGDQQSLHCGRW